MQECEGLCRSGDQWGPPAVLRSSVKSVKTGRVLVVEVCMNQQKSWGWVIRMMECGRLKVMRVVAVVEIFYLRWDTCDIGIRKVSWGAGVTEVCGSVVGWEEVINNCARVWWVCWDGDHGRVWGMFRSRGHVDMWRGLIRICRDQEWVSGSGRNEEVWSDFILKCWASRVLDDGRLRWEIIETLRVQVL